MNHVSEYLQDNNKIDIIGIIFLFTYGETDTQREEIT